MAEDTLFWSKIDALVTKHIIPNIKCYTWSANGKFCWNIYNHNFHPYILTFDYKNKCLSQTFVVCLYGDFISITSNVGLAKILHQEGGIKKNDFENSLKISKKKNMYYFIMFSKMHSQHTTHCTFICTCIGPIPTLHTTHWKLHCTLNTTLSYCILLIYHLILKTFKSCLSLT